MESGATYKRTGFVSRFFLYVSFGYDFFLIKDLHF